MSGDLFTTEAEQGPRMKVRQVETGGRRCVRVAAYLFELPGQDPELRVMLAGAWLDDPELPVSDRCITLPATALPALREALDAIEAEG